MMSNGLQYVRTDRNGTKYYHDWTCPRCGGAGQAQKWYYTGSICYACGGTGKRNRPLVVKEYTEEHAAKLEERRIARLKKYEEEHADEIAQEKARSEEIARESNIRALADLGCDANGIGYVLNGNTYPVKDQIKANGGKWIYGVWVCPVEISAKGVEAVRIDISGTKNEYGTYEAYDLIWEARK